MNVQQENEFQSESMIGTTVNDEGRTVDETCRACLALFVLGMAVLAGCSQGTTSTARSYDEELKLTIRVGRGDITDSERQSLLKENHPILAQVGEPTIATIVEIFASLPESVQQELHEKSFVKWRMSDLSLASRAVMSRAAESVVKRRFATVENQSPPLSDRALAEIMADVETGFAIVEEPTSKKKYLSWFAFGSKIPSPVWVTLVNSKHSGAPEYVRAHMDRLPMLRTFKASNPPPFLSTGQPITLFASSPWTL